MTGSPQKRTETQRGSSMQGFILTKENNTLWRSD